MSKALIIAEKPSVAKTIAGALFGVKPTSGLVFRGKGPDGRDITISSAAGHVLELAKPEAYNELHGKDYSKWLVSDLPSLPKPNWDFIQVPRFSVKDGNRQAATKMLAELCALAREHSGCEIINACDSEREGELIFRKILGEFPVDRTTTKLSRMWWNSMLEDAVKEAYVKRGPLSKFDGLARAGYSRDEADWLVGMNMTVLASKTLPRGVGDWKMWSVGRVQTPTLALIVERDLAIEAFAGEAFHEVYASFDGLEAKSVLDKIMDSPDRKKLLGAPRISDDIDKKAFWDRALAGRYATSATTAPNYKVSDKGTEKASSVLPFDLQEVQKSMFRQFGTPVPETLEILQALYEKHKLISYPRTDSRSFPEDMRAKIHADTSAALAAVTAMFPKLHLSGQKIAPRAIADKSKAFNDKGVTDHYAICPEAKTDGIANLNQKEFCTYLTVLQATLMALDEPCRTAVVTRRFTQQGGEGPYSPAEFSAKAEKVTTPGYTRWTAKEKSGKPELPPLPASKTCVIGEVTVRDLKTNPPKPLDDDTLLTAMKNAGSNLTDDEVTEGMSAEKLAEVMKGRGIGTGGTRASIITTLLDRHYIERVGSHLEATANGRLLIQSMNKLDPTTTSAAMTAEWEMVLRRMKDGEDVSREKFLDGLLAHFILIKEKFVAATTRSMGPSGLVKGVPLDGVACPKTKKPILDRGTAFEAPGFPDILLWKTSYGKTWTAEEFVTLLNGVIAGKPVLFTGLKTRAGQEYEAPLTIDEQEGKIVIFEPSEKVKGAKCPKKGTPITDRGKYWVADGWPKLKLYKQAYGRAWTIKEYLEVLDGNLKGKPPLSTKLVSKKNTPYEATLLASRDAERWELRFPDRGPPRAMASASSAGSDGETWENARPV